MKMQSLELLHISMRQINTRMQQFYVKTGAAEFDCLFSTEEEPFVLTLTSRGLFPRFFKFAVERGYCIKEYLGDMYGPLVEILRTNGRSGESLRPRNFLEQLDLAIPRSARPTAVPTSAEVARLRHDLEERDRPYFDHWIYWRGRESDGKDGPTPENLHKTLVLLGREAVAHSLDNRASSRWSATSTGKDWRS
jgi:hypothetical protein